MKANEIREIIATTKARSAWARGLRVYAEEIINTISDYGTDIDEGIICNYRMYERAALNGASDWSHYSWSGCSLIYNHQIAETLCNPTELKRTRNGERKPNSREDWLDVQARALFQASRLVWDAIETLKLRDAINDAYEVHAAPHIVAA